MDYVTQADLVGLIPSEFILEALDDDEDGAADADAWAAVLLEVHDAIDSVLSARHSTPFVAPLPKLVARAARYFAIEQLYGRRQVQPPKHLADEISGLHALLRAVARGEAQLGDDTTITSGKGGKAITEDAGTHLTNGGMIL
ncbi:MAG: DUF1320 family protein [Verrucomicrobia bacterium]|nr:DUF1320 family protein [Verrucomicrobiota bacterium]